MEEKKQKDLLIIMPAYNEEKNIVHIVAGDYFCTCHGGYSAMDA